MGSRASHCAGYSDAEHIGLEFAELRRSGGVEQALDLD